MDRAFLAILLFGVAISFAGTLINAYVARFLISMFKPDRPADFGGYCVAIGLALGRHPEAAEDFHQAAPIIAVFTGTALALWLIWYLWFRRQVDA